MLLYALNISCYHVTVRKGKKDEREPESLVSAEFGDGECIHRDTHTHTPSALT